MIPRALAVIALSAVFALGACAAEQTRPRLFSTEWSDDGGRSIAEVYTRIKSARPPRGADVVVAVSGNSDKLVGMPLGGGAKWTFAHPLEARPIVVGSVVIGAGGGEVFALDAISGKKLWDRRTGAITLHGAGDDGTVTAISFTQVGGVGSTLLAVSHDGAVRRQIETDKEIGAPAVVAGIAFVPWQNQYVSAIDLSTGDSVGRVTLREKVSRAWTSGGALYFGEVGIFRFDDHIKDASKNQATHVGLAPRELPGTPRLMVPAGEKVGPSATALDRARLYARPSGPDGALAIDSGRYYATYFRLVMGFDSGSGRLMWVHTHASDVLGGDAASGSLVTCDERGKITTYDAGTGMVAAEQDLGETIKSCVVQTDAYRPSVAPRAPSPPLAAQIGEALQNREGTLATAQRLLLREMATLEDERVTKTLVDLASDVRTSPILIGDARAALANRRNGARSMLDALARHYDFLKDVLRPPPVGPIAQALAAMQQTDAAPLLAAHLLDPADSDDDIVKASAALTVIGSAGEVPAMKQFFALYRASAESDEMAAAVANVGQGLIKLGGKDGRALVEQAVKDPATVPIAKARLEAILQGNPESAALQGAPATPPAKSPPPPGKKK